MQSLYDPLAPLGKYRPLAWGLLALVVIGFQGPRFLGDMQYDLWENQDFFQDWAAVKYFNNGFSPYTHLGQAVESYLLLPNMNNEGNEVFVLNGHPPPSLFIVIPFSYFSFRQAILVWNIAGFILYGLSLTLIWKTLELRFPFWGIFPLTVITLIGGPIISQVGMANWTFLFLFFLVLNWRALKNQRWIEAGFWLGTMTALKLFPGLLALPWLLQKRWKALGSCLAVFFLWNILSGFWFGFQTLSEYYFSILPQVGEFYRSINNVSWAGFFAKLFYPEITDQIYHLINAPLLGKSLSRACFILILCLWLTLLGITKPSAEKAFLWGVFTILLAGPITWDHYLIMAIPGIVYCWKEVSAFSRLQPLFLIGLIAILVPQGDVQYFLKNSGWLIGAGGPLCSLTFLALPTYGLTLLFTLVLFMEKRKSWHPLGVTCFPATT